MEATVINEKIARDIINILAENMCTVSEGSEILSYVSRAIRRDAAVQKVEKLFDTES